MPLLYQLFGHFVKRGDHHFAGALAFFGADYAHVFEFVHDGGGFLVAEFEVFLDEGDGEFAFFEADFGGLAVEVAHGGEGGFAVFDAGHAFDLDGLGDDVFIVFGGGLVAEEVGDFADFFVGDEGTLDAAGFAHHFGGEEEHVAHA